jgi:6-phosphogluconolactonase
MDGEPWAAELRLSADERWLLATERRSSTLSVFAVQADGRVALRSQQPVEAQPRGMQVAPDGRHVLVAGQASHHVGCWALDSLTGALAPRSRVAVGANPNWIEFFRTPA